MTTRWLVVVMFAAACGGGGDDSGTNPDGGGGASDKEACFLPAHDTDPSSCIEWAHLISAQVSMIDDGCSRQGGEVQDSGLCPESHLVGCCHMRPASGTGMQESDCYYDDDTDPGSIEGVCSSLGGTWSTTP